MCLRLAVEIKHDEDIVCYKCLEISKPFIYPYAAFSPIFKTRWEFGVTKSIGMPKKAFICNQARKSNPDRILGDAFHSFACFDDAYHYALYHGLSVFKCIIPKDTNYVFKGFQMAHDVSVVGYASEKLRVQSIAYSNIPIPVKSLEKNTEPGNQ